MKNILIHCSINSFVGIGHYRRCLSFANELSIYFNLYFAIEDGNHNLDHNYNYIFLNNDCINDQLLNIVNHKTIDIVIFDIHQNYNVNSFSNLLSILFLKNVKLVSIDSLFEYQNYFDIIFYPSFNIPNSFKINSKKIFYGWDCFLINPLYNKINWSPGNNILILTGGSDKMNYTSYLPEILLNEIPKTYNIIWVKGPFALYPNKTVLNNKRFKLIDSPLSIDKYIINSNYALTLYGVTFFELTYYGLPTVVFSPYENKDLDNLEIIKNKNIASVGVDHIDSVNKLNYLLQNDNFSKDLSENSKKILKSSGKNKFIKLILNIK
jgi:spore coat polysaccharide biosynthesis predicted glycosyltransferase SpsG